mmetsp:Transcript_31057/g.90863  ORF Transcript_31057/g.90863 Transcript_31057/m.90863 type:complete len:265 (-) Transcript_31057:141-935(-)
MQTDPSSDLKDAMCFEHADALKMIYVHDSAKLPDGDSLPTMAVVRALLEGHPDLLRKCAGTMPMKGQYPRAGGTWLNVLTAGHPDGVVANPNASQPVGNGPAGNSVGAASASDKFFSAQTEKIHAEKKEKEQSTHAVHFQRGIGAGGNVSGGDQQFVLHSSIGATTLKAVVRESMQGSNSGVWSRQGIGANQVLWLKCSKCEGDDATCTTATFKCRVIGDDAMNTPIANLLQNYSADKQTLRIQIYYDKDVEQVDNSDLLNMLG